MYRMILSLLALGFMSGCTMNAVQYQPDFNLVSELKDQNIRSISVGDISNKEPALNRISLRGSPMVSTYSNSYADYLEAAIKEQLLQSGLYEESSTIEISGELLENKVSVASFSIGTANISARFIVKNSENIRFNKIVAIEHQWPSSFVGAIAIPNAQNNYPLAVQKLINKLMSDSEFISAVSVE
jgi:hypothetical protein